MSIFDLSFLGLSLIDWGATFFTLVYLYFAIRNNSICFLFGIIASALWMVTSYKAGLKFDAALQVFYILISILGIYRWRYGGSNKVELPISDHTWKQHLCIIGFGALSSWLLIHFSQYIEFINFASLDAITTVFLIIGTILLIERKLSSWIYLVAADFVYIYIYGLSGLWLFVGIMILYIIFGINGYLNWKNIYLPQEKPEFASNKINK